MFSELKKSVNYIIYERTTSPFWGSFVFSWLICNWKIILTIFIVSEENLAVNKIQYISDNFIDWKPIALYPFISTLILVSIFPLLSNGAYWITIIYSKWRLDKRNEVEKKQLLSIEQSIAIRVSNTQLQETYSKLVSDKEAEITALKIQIEELNQKLSEPSQVMIENISRNSKKMEIEEWNSEYELFKDSAAFNDFQKILYDVNSNRSITNYSTPPSSMVYFQSLGLIRRSESRASQELTDKGLHFSKIFNKNKFETKHM
ncbi:hypothetical protein ACFQZX_03090 [Mucilaginibacter litoreus]|uniref:Uncharacterized protein n=1 Tax=Mucilaginibacter litoreus TaxID=1048221 RepID=A0ABW3AP85_9SPHI